LQRRALLGPDHLGLATHHWQRIGQHDLKAHSLAGL
jgi:hypothetical protein